MSDEGTPGSATLQPHEGFAELAMTRLGEQPLSAVLQHIAELATRTVPAIDEASVTLMGDGKARTVAFTGSLAVDLDERQYRPGRTVHGCQPLRADDPG